MLPDARSNASRSDPYDHEEANQDLITSMVASVHVPYDVAVRDTITGRVICDIRRGCPDFCVRVTAS